jgi:hypothetical protein
MRAAAGCARRSSARRIVALALLASASACGHPAPRAPVPHAVGRAAASHRPRSGAGAGAPGTMLGQYSVAYDGHGELTVEAELEHPGTLFGVESGAEGFVQDFEVAGASGPFARGGKGGTSFVATACGTGKCRIRYRFALRDAAKKLDDVDVASEEGETIEAPPSTWLLAPSTPEVDARVRFRVKTDGETAFVTGIYRSHEAPGAWDIALGDLWTAPYSAFGPFRLRPLVVAKEPKGELTIAIAPGKMAVTDDELVSWTADAARAITTYFGRYPLPEALVLLVPSRGRWVGEGKTLSGGGGSIFMRIGEQAPMQALREDWVLVHEMTHLAFPSVAREHDWAEEGLATYVEPFARARAGLMTAEAAWRSLVDGLPNGLPAAGDQGLDHTPTWGRTYWGGALFYLLADIEIRKRTGNRLGLEHALRGLLAAGGNNATRWPLDDALAAGDKAVGVPVLVELHAAMSAAPRPVDLEALWRALGVVRARGAIRFDDSAPLAAIRRALTAP